MSLLNSVLKVFVGDKSKQDVKSIMPIVKEIKRYLNPKYANLEPRRASEQKLKNSNLRITSLPVLNIIQGN